jgi:ribosomal protein S18 acetylase RimI-like enzyme
MTIRPATLDDAALISALNDDVQRLHHERYPDLFKSPSPETFPAEHVAGLLADPNTILLIALEGDAPVGYLYAEIRRRPESALRYAMEVVYINHISVKPEAQGRGHGKQLIEAACAIARQEGIQRAALDVWAFNTAAHHAFEQYGFADFNHVMWKELDEKP